MPERRHAARSPGPDPPGLLALHQCVPEARGRVA